MERPPRWGGRSSSSFDVWSGRGALYGGDAQAPSMKWRSHDVPARGGAAPAPLLRLTGNVRAPKISDIQMALEPLTFTFTSYA